MTAVSLRLPDDVSQRLRQLAARTGRSRTFYILAALREHLDDLEDVYLAEQRLVDLRLGKSHTVPLDEAKTFAKFVPSANPDRLTSISPPMRSSKSV